MSTSLDSILSNSASGLRASQAAISVISDNVANAGVAGYTEKHLTLSTVTIDGQGNGVRTGLITRSVDATLQATVWSSASKVGALSVRAQVLGAIDATQGTPGDGSSLSDALSGLQAGFTQLQSQPSAPTQQSTVVAAATTLTNTINATANTVIAQRNGVQNQIVTAVDTFNSAMAVVQSTTHDIIRATVSSQDTAALEDIRDSALQTLSGLLNLHYAKQTSGDITILGASGFSVPMDARLSTTAAVLSPASSYVVGGTAVPPVMLVSSNPNTPPLDVTGRLSGGQIGGLIQLRDQTLPAYTASLDTLSVKLASKFSAQGLSLFTDGSGSATLASYAGVSSQIQVNPAVTAAPSMVRDGTTAGALNPDAAAGFSGLIDAVLSVSFAASGTATSLGTDAAAFVSQQANATAQANGDLSRATAYQTTVSTKFADGAGVDVDQELSLLIQLQNSYQANAKVFQVSTTLFNALLDATRNV